MNTNLLKNKSVLYILLFIVMIAIPLITNRYWTDVASTAMFYILLALGLNIIVGYAGLLDLGYAAFFAVGSYTTGILTTEFGVSFWVSLFLGAIFATLLGVLIGIPTLRLRSDYLAIVTLGFGEIIRLIANNSKFTGGASGIYGIPKPKIGSFVFQSNVLLYYLMFLFVLLAIFVIWRLGNSRVGRAWKYIREDEDAAEAMGVNGLYYKLLAYGLGAMFGGLAGSLFAVKMSAIAPESFSFMQSAMILLAVVLGGIGRISGVILGAVLVILLPEAMRSFSDWRIFLFGVLLVLTMIFRPNGLWPAKKETEDTDDPKPIKGGSKSVVS
jgi:branched-chain amino acid transport system permease protein